MGGPAVTDPSAPGRPSAAAPSDCGLGGAGGGGGPGVSAALNAPAATASRPATAHAIRNATARRTGIWPRSRSQLKRRPINRSNATSAEENRLPNTNRTGIAIRRPRTIGPAHDGMRVRPESGSPPAPGSGRLAAAVTLRIPTPAQPRTRNASSTTPTADRRVTATPAIAAIEAPRRTQAAPRSRASRVGSARTAMDALIARAAGGSHRSRGSIRLSTRRRTNAATSSNAARIGAFTPSRLSSRTAWAISPTPAARTRIRRATGRVMRAPVRGA